MVRRVGFTAQKGKVYTAVSEKTGPISARNQRRLAKKAKPTKETQREENSIG